MRLAKFAGSFALFIAGMAVLTFISLFVVGAYLATWPIMRVSPRSRRLTSLMELATAVMGAARAYGLDKSLTPDTDEGEEVTGEVVPDDTEATDDTVHYPYEDDGVLVMAPGVYFDPTTEIITWHGREFRGSTTLAPEGGEQ